MILVEWNSRKCKTNLYSHKSHNLGGQSLRDWLGKGTKGLFVVMRLYFNCTGAYICENLLNTTLKNGNFYFGNYTSVNLIFKTVWLVKIRLKILRMEIIHIETTPIPSLILILNIMVFIFINSVIKHLAIESLFFNGHTQDFWHCLKAVTEKVVGCFDSKLENWKLGWKWTQV